MQKGVEITGKSLRVKITGEILKWKVKDLVCDREHRKIIGFWVKDLQELNTLEFLPLNKIEAIGSDAIAVSSKNAVVPPETIPHLQEALAPSNNLRDYQLVAQDGRGLGTIVDFYFDSNTGIIEGYEVRGGLFADPITERAFVPATPIADIGDRIAIVPCEIIALMEEQDNLLSTTSVEIALSAAQKAFVVGKVAREAVYATNGEQLIVPGQLITSAHAAVAQNGGVLKQLYCAAGGNATKPARESSAAKSRACIAYPAVIRARGWRVRKLVRAREGEIIAVPGEVVTERTIERASIHCQEKALLEAVGLKSDESTILVCVEIALEPRSRAEGPTLWATSSETSQEQTEWETFTSREREIRNALGRPVTQAICDRNQQAILNIGDLITYQAVERARQAQTLDRLLNAVYE
ncbi:MAG: PRC-barrel domain-containing protein [Cyanobacteriota bacterium]|nr:PRC-barrel domain-containing protein [Cyanobacteriota bacterium]